MKKKKRGSAFMVVVIVMAIIFTTGTTVLALTASNYKTRINESKRLQNLYEADSGLDLVKNIIIKTSQEAIKYADKEVKSKLIESTDESKADMSKEDINNLFKEKFYGFLSSNDLKYLIKSKQIINYVSDSGDIEILSLIKESEDEYENEKYNIDITKYEYNNETGITIGVKSTFETKDGALKNKRTVSTEFKIIAPEYAAEVKNINIYPVFDGKAITVDGDMNVNLSNKDLELKISGDIWVKGSDDINTSDSNPIFTFDKYNSGININNSTFNIEGNIYTSNTFSTNNDVIVDVDGDIYAKNIYVGKALRKDESNNYVESKLNNNNITFNKNVIVNNDLAMNSTDSNVTIENNFYGISDKTGDVRDSNKALNSSSIIINESQDSTLTVVGDSYILGVAYLNATDSDGKQYQTGESVAVKGNYLAYTDVQGVLDGENNVTLKYYSPLQLLEGSAETKATYFTQYYSTNTNKKYNLQSGGVNLIGQVKSVGASIKDSTGKIQEASLEPNDMAVVNEQRNEYARNVFAMGDTTNLGNEIYENQKVLRTVENEIVFDNMKNIEKLEEVKNEEDKLYKGLILNNNESEMIINDNKINNKKIISGLIISKGDIKIQGSFDFTGTIITLGNITFEGSGNKVIKYDAGVVRNVIADNYDNLKDIFKKKSSKGKEVKVSSSLEIYNSDEFLKQSLWKIER